MRTYLPLGSSKLNQISLGGGAALAKAVEIHTKQIMEVNRRVIRNLNFKFDMMRLHSSHEVVTFYKTIR